MNIYVFKTSLQEKDLSKIAEKMQTLPFVLRWSVDLDDCDKIMKVVSLSPNSDPFCRELKQIGINCEELS